jgi:ABC-type transporter Mla subunit MlaD
MDQNTKLNALQHDKLTRAQSLNIPQNQRVDNLVNNQQHFNQFANQSNHLLQPNQQHFNPTIGNPTAGNHQLLNRHISAPPNNQLQIPGYSNDQLNNGFGSSSTTTLNQSNEDMFQSSFTSNSQLQMFAPSKSIWGHSEFSLSHIVPNNLTNNQSNR